MRRGERHTIPSASPDEDRSSMPLASAKLASGSLEKLEMFVCGSE